MFSIIIPLYNKEKSCARSIQSVLDQTCDDWELIIVNDGSTDNSLEIARKTVKDDKRVCFIEQNNRGVSVARNSGIYAAQSEYIAFLDADDFWHYQYIETMKKVIDEYPGYLWWGSDYIKGNEASIKQHCKMNASFSWRPDDIAMLDYFKESISLLCICMDSIVMRRSTLLEIGGFPENLVTCEDQDLFSRFAMRSKLPRIPYKLAFYFADAENRCCTRVQKDRIDVPLMPFVKDNIDLLSSAKWTKNDNIYWVREYVCDRLLLYSWRRYRMGFLSWPLYMSEIIKCRKTRESRLFFLFAVLFSLIPRGFYSFLGKAWPRNLPHFMTTRTDN